jgi:hypothetical protein
MAEVVSPKVINLKAWEAFFQERIQWGLEFSGGRLVREGDAVHA